MSAPRSLIGLIGQRDDVDQPSAERGVLTLYARDLLATANDLDVLAGFDLVDDFGKLRPCIRDTIGTLHGYIVHLLVRLTCGQNRGRTPVQTAPLSRTPLLSTIRTLTSSEMAETLRSRRLESLYGPSYLYRQRDGSLRSTRALLQRRPDLLVRPTGQRSRWKVGVVR